MTLPLYSANLTHPSRYPGGGNAGLWYDKFCDTWRQEGGIWTLAAREKGKSPKLEWIAKVSGKGVGDRDLLKEICARQSRLLKECYRPDAEPLLFHTEWRFVTGLGRQHPVENGFAWHQTLGVPYLPGSSVKGMVRNWAVCWEEKVDAEEVKRIFGPRNDKSKKDSSHEVMAGSVIFLDALPVEPVKLEADVMTPHYGDYYANGAPPGDWMSPNPIPFLVVAPNQTFQFAIIPRPGTDTGKEDVERAQQWLEEALTQIGAGAKTAVGYGVFRADVSNVDDGEEVWENARLRYEPGDAKFTATVPGRRTAWGTRDNCVNGGFYEKLSKRKQKKIRKEGVLVTVKVQKKLPNVYQLLEIVSADDKA